MISKHLVSRLVILLVLVFLVQSSTSAYLGTRHEPARTRDFAYVRLQPHAKAQGFGHKMEPASDSIWPFSHTLVPGGYHYYWADRQVGTGLYGDFSAADNIDFFVCDEDNFNLWDAGSEARVYLLTRSTQELEWKFKVPSTDTWYKVDYNRYQYFSSIYVSGHHCIDHTGPNLDWNIDTGATYSGIKEIEASASDDHFGVARMRLYVDSRLVDQETDGDFFFQWDTSEYSDGYHELQLIAEDGVGNQQVIDAEVTVSNVGSYLPIVAGGIIAVVAVSAVALHKRESKPIESDETDFFDTTEQGSAVIRFCPSCGTQIHSSGVRYCSNCGAKLRDGIDLE